MKKNMHALAARLGVLKKEDGSSTAKILIALFAFVAIVVIAAVIILAIMLNPVNKFVKAYQGGDYDGAITLYQDEIRGDDGKVKKAEKKLDEEIDRIVKDFEDQKADFNATQKSLETIQKTGLLADKVKEQKEAVRALNDSRNAYNAGIEGFDNKDYATAVENLQNVIEADKNYEDAQAKLKTASDEMKKEVLAQVQALEAEGKLEEAYQVLYDATDVLKEEELLAKQQEIHDQLPKDYTQKVTTTKKKKPNKNSANKV